MLASYLHHVSAEFPVLQLASIAFCPVTSSTQQLFIHADEIHLSLSSLSPSYYDRCSKVLNQHHSPSCMPMALLLSIRARPLQSLDLPGTVFLRQPRMLRALPSASPPSSSQRDNNSESLRECKSRASVPASGRKDSGLETLPPESVTAVCMPAEAHQLRSSTIVKEEGSSKAPSQTESTQIQKILKIPGDLLR